MLAHGATPADRRGALAYNGRMNGEGLILDRYRPVKTAGAGGFGTVLKAWDTRIQRYVAIKTIELSAADALRAAPRPDADVPPWEGPEPGEPDKPDDDPAHTLSAQRSLANLPGLDEARTAAMLQDPNIVQVHDFEVRGTTAYLIMEYVEGLSLSALLREHDDALTLDQVAAVFAGISHALSVAHAAGVLHLDIKPDNVLIDEKGAVKVTDFGLATLADASGTGYAGGGTIGYMPPEQIGREPLDERTDEWALASVAYEMLVGENPFRVRSLDRAREAIVDAELLVPSLCWDALDEEADDVVFDALDPDREGRFPTVAAFADALLPLLGDPEHGGEELASLVSLGELPDDEEDEEGEDVRRRPRLTERLFGRRGVGDGGGDAQAGGVRERLASPRSRRVLAHLIGFAGSAAVAGAALLGMPPLVGDGVGTLGDYLANSASLPEQTPFWLLLAAVAMAGAVRPHAGALASFSLFGVALCMQKQFALGLALIAATAVWWRFVARRPREFDIRGHGVRANSAHAPANAAFAPALTGALHLGAASPLAAGFCLSPLRALATAAYGVLCALALSASSTPSFLAWNAWTGGAAVDLSGAQQNLVGAFTDASLWCMAAGWLASALLTSLLRRRDTRGFAIAAVAAGEAAFAAGMAAAYTATGGAGAFAPHAMDCALTAVAFAAALACCSFGGRPRARDPHDEGVY